MIIGIDVDSVVADICPEWFGRYNRDYNDNLTPEKVTEWDTFKFVKPECGKHIYDYLKDVTLYDNILPIEGSQEYTKKLRELGHRLIYITNTPIETPGVKFRWLVKYGFLPNDDRESRCNYFEAVDKSLIKCDILVDDKYENARDAYRVGLLFDQPWNINCDYNPRANNWKDVYEHATFMAYLDSIYFPKRDFTILHSGS